MLVPPLSIQLDQYYLATNNTADPEAAYVILIGGNDYIGISQGYNVTAEEVVDIVEMTMENLFKHGARRFILGTVPPSALLPPFLAALPEVVEAFDAHNELLRDLGDTFPTDHGRTSVWVFDFGGEVLRVATDFRKLGFTSQEPCYSVSNLGEGGAEVCANPSAHFRWDVLHPTTAAHAIIGEAFVQQLGETVFGKGGSTYTPTGGYGG
jgi:phospholipase/lecithinase/hemolysin